MLSWDDFSEETKRFHLSPEQLESVKEFYGQADKDLFDRMLACLPGEVPMAEIMKAVPCKTDREKFLFLLIASSWRKMEQLYRDSGYPESMLEDISHDLRLWADKAMAEKGYAGLTPRLFEWSTYVLKGKVLQFGRLQCEIPHSFAGNFSVVRRKGELVMLPGKQEDALLNSGDKAVNLHIPAAGPLRRELCIDSLKRIVRFMEQFHPGYDYRAFVCYSWILDPVWHQWNPGSNIAVFQKFGHLFNIPGSDQTQEVIWRVFGDRYLRKTYDKLPENTSMQRFVKAFLGQGGTFREFGFYILREELPALFAKCPCQAE